MGIETLIGNII